MTMVPTSRFDGATLFATRELAVRAGEAAVEQIGGVNYFYVMIAGRTEWQVLLYHDAELVHCFGYLRELG
jgi:hypothetical protein